MLICREDETTAEDGPFEDEVSAIAGPSQLEDPPLVLNEDNLNSSAAIPHQRSVPIGREVWRNQSRDLIWKKKNLDVNEDNVRFLGNQELSAEIAEKESPYDFFSLFINDEIIDKIVYETNLYIVQKGISSCPPVTALEIRQFFGILIFMSVYHYANVRSYWSRFGFTPIMETMTLNRFEKIRSAIHFNDNDQHKHVDHVDHDRLHKIRPIIDHLNNEFSARAPSEQRLSLDEQMCASKIGHFMKQYLPNKPHKWGFKLFVLCSLSGFAHKFEVYSGKTDFERLNDEPDLGPVGNTAIRLCRIVPPFINHIIYFDNFYTSIPLLHYLAKQGIYSLGTIQRNRLGKNCKIPTQKDYNKEAVLRGTYEEQVATYEGVDISVTCWKDNKQVVLASTYVGAEPAESVSRYDKKQKRTIDIPCPKIVKDYNAHMGGVDLMDSFLGRYRIRIKSRKWYIRLFYHMIDMAAINAWVLYKKANKNRSQTLMSLPDFRSELANTLCLYKSLEIARRGRPSTQSIEREIQAKKRKGPMKPIPSKDVRMDGVGHHERRCDRKNRCKLPGCKGFSRTECTKCKVALCHTKERNCFARFHCLPQ